jgi:protein-S-isoprenylcysteine O-methyltransferase Ste14
MESSIVDVANRINTLSDKLFPGVSSGWVLQVDPVVDHALWSSLSFLWDGVWVGIIITVICLVLAYVFFHFLVRVIGRKRLEQMSHEIEVSRPRWQKWYVVNIALSILFVLGALIPALSSSVVAQHYYLLYFVVRSVAMHYFSWYVKKVLASWIADETPYNQKNKKTTP